jgi:hypothetical protein
MYVIFCPYHLVFVFLDCSYVPRSRCLGNFEVPQCREGGRGIGIFCLLCFRSMGVSPPVQVAAFPFNGLRYLPFSPPFPWISPTSSKLERSRHHRPGHQHIVSRVVSFSSPLLVLLFPFFSTGRGCSTLLDLLFLFFRSIQGGCFTSCSVFRPFIQ